MRSNSQETRDFNRGSFRKEYLVGLGVDIDKPGFKELDNTINQTTATINRVTSSWGKDFVTASGLVVTAIAGVTTSVVGLMRSVAQQDLAMEKYARQMLVGKSAAQEMKLAIDALGESVEDIQLTPELFERYKKLIADGRSMRVGDDYAETMRSFRDLMFEFTRLKQEASYALQWVGYYLIKYLSKPLNDARQKFKSINDSIVKNMPVWSEKVARVLTYIINVGRHFWDLLVALGKAVYNVWDAFPRGIKIATAALAAFFAILQASPLSRMVMLVSSLLLLVDDYFGYMEGKQAALDPIWDKLNAGIAGSKALMEDFGRAMCPVWDTLAEYLEIGKDGLIGLAEGFADWMADMYDSKEFGVFIQTVKELCQSFWDLVKGVLSFVVDGLGVLNDALENNDTMEAFTLAVKALVNLFTALVSGIAKGCKVLGEWFTEAGRSEALHDLIDAFAELLSLALELYHAFSELVITAIADMFTGMSHDAPAYTFRDALRAIIDVITAMIRLISSLLRGLTDLFKTMKDNSALKAFWRGLGEMVKAVYEIIMRALGAAGKLGQALMSLIKGDWRGAARMGGAALDALFGGGVAEASDRKFNFGGKVPTGDLSAEHEGAVDSIGEDSTGGKSYGSYQIARGTMGSFLDWLRSYNPGYSEALSSAGSVGSSAFDAEWKRIARTDPEGFHQLQHDFIAETHYADQVNALNNMGIDVESRSQTLREVLWSMAVQMRNYTPDIFKSALNGRDIDEVTDEELIPELYEVRKRYFSQSTPRERQAVWDRYDNSEMPMALEMLSKERKYMEFWREIRESKSPYANKEGEPPRFTIQEPPSEMRDPGLWDRIKGGVAEAWDGITEWIMPTAYSGAMQNVDTVMLNSLMRQRSEYASTGSAGGGINISINNNINVTNPNATAAEIGEQVSDITVDRLREQVDYISRNRAIGGGVSWT